MHVPSKDNLADLFTKILDKKTQKEMGARRGSNRGAQKARCHTSQEPVQGQRRRAKEAGDSSGPVIPKVKGREVWTIIVDKKGSRYPWQVREA